MQDPILPSPPALSNPSSSSSTLPSPSPSPSPLPSPFLVQLLATFCFAPGCQGPYIHPIIGFALLRPVPSSPVLVYDTRTRHPLGLKASPVQSNLAPPSLVPLTSTRISPQIELESRDSYFGHLISVSCLLLALAIWVLLSAQPLAPHPSTTPPCTYSIFVSRRAYTYPTVPVPYDVGPRDISLAGPR